MCFKRGHTLICYKSKTNLAQRKRGWGATSNSQGFYCWVCPLCIPQVPGTECPGLRADWSRDQGQQKPKAADPRGPHLDQTLV